MKTVKVLLPLLALTGFASALSYKAVDITLKQGTGEMTVGLNPRVTPTLGVKNPAVRNGVAYVGASHAVGQWNVGLSPSLPLSLNIQQDVGSMTLALAGLPLTALKVVSNAGEVVLSLPARTLTADVTHPTGSLDVYVPADTGVQITVSKFDRGSLIVEGQEVAAGQNLTGTYRTANFATAKNRITLKLAQGSGEVNLHAPGTAAPALNQN